MFCPKCSTAMNELEVLFVCQKCFFVIKKEKEEEKIPTELSAGSDKIKTLLPWMTENVSIFGNDKFVEEFSGIKYGFLYGDVQAGKTSSQQGIAVYNYLINNETTFIITMDRKDQKNQAMMSMDNLYGEKSIDNLNGWKNYRCKNDLQKIFPENIDFVYFDDIKKNERKKVIVDCLTKKSKKIIFILSNIQLKKLEDIIKNTNDPTYHLVVDECDKLSKTEVGEVPARQENYDFLRQNAKSVWGISATSFSELFTNSEIETSSIYVLPNHKNYKGIKKFFFNPIEKPTNDRELTSSIKRYLENLQEETKESICLLNVSRFKKTHNEMIDYFYHTFDENWCFVSYNGDGVKVNCKIFETLERKILQLTKRISGEICKPSFRANTFTWQKIQIGDFLELLRQLNENRDMPPYIVIVSGDLADRGINFTSNDYSKKNRLHLTHMLYLPKNVDCTDYIQAMRPCGIYEDNIIPEITAPLDVINDIERSWNIQQIIMKREKYNYDNFRQLMDSCTFDKNLETEKKLTKKCKTRLAFVKEEKELEGEYKEENEDIIKMRNDIQKYLSGEKNSMIAVFLSSLDINKKYSKKELVELLEMIGYVQPEAFFRAITRKNTKWSRCYFREYEDGWKIRDELVGCWKS